MKKCIKCQVEKSLLEFHRYKPSKDGYKSVCKFCRNAEMKEHYSKNSDRIKNKSQQYRNDNPTYNREYYVSNSKYFSTYRKVNAPRYKKWRIDNRERVNEYVKQKMKNDPEYKLARRLRS